MERRERQALLEANDNWEQKKSLDDLAEGEEGGQTEADSGGCGWDFSATLKLTPQEVIAAISVPSLCLRAEWWSKIDRDGVLMAAWDLQIYTLG